MHFGSSLEVALEKAVEQGKRRKPLSDAQRNAKTQETLTRWLGPEAAPKKYRDPMARFNKEQ